LAAATTSRESNTRKGGYQKIITKTTAGQGRRCIRGWQGGPPLDLSHRTE